MEEGEQINEQIRRQFEGAGDMVDGLPRIVTHDERVSGIRFTTVRAALVQACYACPREVVIIDDEHGVSFLTSITSGGSSPREKYTHLVRRDYSLRRGVFPQ